MKTHYYETCIVPTGYFDIFCDYVLEATKEAIEQKPITQKELQKFNQESTKSTTKNFAKSAKKLAKNSTKNYTKTPTKNLSNPIWHCCNADFSEISSNLAIAESQGIESQMMIVRAESTPQSLLKELQDFTQTLSERVGEKVGFAYSVKKCENVDWIEAYKRGVSPIECARFYIRPSWCEPPKSSYAQTTKPPKSTKAPKNAKSSEFIDIIIDPSLAFGSGHHASTFLCLEELHKVDLEGNLHNRVCLDLGCGSGILGIAMAKMGAKVDVCDIDEYAIEQTRKNFAQNRVDYSKAYQSTLDKMLASPSFDTKYELICANILADILLPLRDDFALALNRAKSRKSKKNYDKPIFTPLLILSGIIESRAPLIISHFCAKDSAFVFLDEKCKDEWVCLKFALQN